MPGFLCSEVSSEFVDLPAEGALFLRESLAFDSGFNNIDDVAALKAELKTTKGIFKLHKQFWHLQAPELSRRICSLFPASEHENIKKMCVEVVKGCSVCRRFTRPSFTPKRGGFWSHGVNHIIASDVFHVDSHAIIHIIDLFSGFSLFHYVGRREPKNSDLQVAVATWFSIFGVCRIFFSDRGGEYTSHAFSEFLTMYNVKPLFSPPQAPYTNGVCERHNGIGKIWINRLRSACPQAPFSLVVAEAQLVKNLTTRRHGYSAQLLALGLPDGMRLTTLYDDLTVPGPPVASRCMRWTSRRCGSSPWARIREALPLWLPRGWVVGRLATPPPGLEVF